MEISSRFGRAHRETSMSVVGVKGIVKSFPDVSPLKIERSGLFSRRNQFALLQRPERCPVANQNKMSDERIRYERYQNNSRRSAETAASDEVGLGPRKTMLVLVIVVGCFAVLWPKIFHPMLVGSSDQPTDPNTGEALSAITSTSRKKKISIEHLSWLAFLRLLRCNIRRRR